LVSFHGLPTLRQEKPSPDNHTTKNHATTYTPAQPNPNQTNRKPEGKGGVRHENTKNNRREKSRQTNLGKNTAPNQNPGKTKNPNKTTTKETKQQ